MRLAFVAALALLLAVPAAASARGRSIMQDDARLLRAGPAVRDATLDEMRGLGVDTVRVLAVWRDYAPATYETRRPASTATPEPAWAPLDGLLAAAHARRLQVLVTLTGPGPAWASGCGGPPRLRGACRPDPRAFGAWVREVGARYPRQRRWTIWNEPNLGRWLTPQYVRSGGRTRAVAPHLYRELALAAAAALRTTGHAGDELLLGETAPDGTTAGGLALGPMAPLRFLGVLLCEDARGRRVRSGDCAHPARLPATGWAHHPYSGGGARPPDATPRPGEITLPTLGRLEGLIDRAGARGLVRRGMPIDLTEVGFQTNPPDALAGMSLAAQARSVDVFEQLAHRDRRVRSVSQYLLTDETGGARFQSGLRFADGRAKPGLDAYRLPIVATRTGVWGRVRPATLLGPQPARLERRTARGWVDAARPRTDSLGYFTVRSAPGTYRLRWGRYVSRTVAAPARRP